MLCRKINSVTKHVVSSCCVPSLSFIFAVLMLKTDYIMMVAVYCGGAITKQYECGSVCSSK